MFVKSILSAAPRELTGPERCGCSARSNSDRRTP